MHVKLAYARKELRLEFPESAPVSVAMVLQSVKDEQPDVYRHWCNKEGRLRRTLSVYLNKEHVRYREGFDTELSDGDEVYVIPAIAGG